MPEIPRGELIGNFWLRRPELKPIETKKHQDYDNVYFTLGEDLVGVTDVHSVQYPSDWPHDKVVNAVKSREKTLESEGCKHCNARNAARGFRVSKAPLSTSPPNPTSAPAEEKRLRIIAGKRPLRDRLLKVWDYA